MTALEKISHIEEYIFPGEGQDIVKLTRGNWLFLLKSFRTMQNLYIHEMSRVRLNRASKYVNDKFERKMSEFSLPAQ